MNFKFRNIMKNIKSLFDVKTLAKLKSVFNVEVFKKMFAKEKIDNISEKIKSYKETAKEFKETNLKDWLERAKVTYTKNDVMIQACTFIGAALLAFGIIVYGGETNTFANEYYWAVEVGDQEVVATSNENVAQDVKNQFVNSFLTEGSEVKSINCEPALTVKERVFDGDVLTKKDDFAIRTENGVDILTEKAKDPSFIKVTTEEVVTANQEIGYETKTISDDSLEEGTSKVQTEGENGNKQTKTTFVKENGKIISQKIISSTVTKAPVAQVVRKGTGSTAVAGAPYSNLGQAVANYALQFVGNPYLYGGTSLTHGCDCSGFVMAVYAHFGVYLPHGAIDMQGYGTGVSESEAMPGDIVCYPRHVAIYIGGGQVVHAMDENHGIVVSNIHYNTEVVTIRRIFD